MSYRGGPHSGDAFGAMMQAALDSGRQATEVCGFLERDDGALASVAAQRYLELSPLDHRALSLVDGPALDIGCGAGRHARALGVSGIAVTALDTSAGCIGLCRHLPHVDAILGSLEQIAKAGGGPFRTVLLMGNNMGLAGRTENLRSFLDDLAAVLEPEGVLLATSLLEPLSDTPLDRLYAAENVGVGRAAGDTRMRFRFENLATPWSDYALIPPSVAEKELSLAGFVCEGIEEFPPYYLLRARRS